MNSESPVNKEPLKFKWSHHNALHVKLVKTFNAVAKYFPWDVKYKVVGIINKNSYPYRLLSDGDVVVQVGAPVDTMNTGRSRAIQLANCVGANGQVLVVEPDENSGEKIENLQSKGKLPQIVFENSGAWSENTSLDLYIDDEHPASNFTGQARQYDEEVMAKYRKVTMPVDSIDNLAEKHNLKVKLVSITTNGAETDILKGMERLISGGLQYICLARTGEGYHEEMNKYGFKLLAYDDRGYTYIKE